MLVDIVEEAGGEAALTREEMVGKLLEKIDDDELCDQMGDLYGVKYDCLLYTSPSPRDQRG